MSAIQQAMERPAAPQETVARFYAAFARLDGAAMQACYAADAQFDDEAFSLRGREQVGGMWRMLCGATQAKGADAWRLDVSDITGRSAHWEAHYRFSATGRLVHNIIEAEFDIGPDGLIRRHRDRFPFWRWSRPACCSVGRPFCVARCAHRRLPSWRFSWHAKQAEAAALKSPS